MITFEFKLYSNMEISQFLFQTLPKLEKVLQQNEMVDLLYDDYGSLKSKHGHELEFTGKREVDPDLEPNVKGLKRFVLELLTEEPPPEEIKPETK